LYPAFEHLSGKLGQNTLVTLEFRTAPEYKKRSQLLGEFLQPLKITVTLTRTDYASAMRTLMKGKFGKLLQA